MARVLFQLRKDLDRAKLWILRRREDEEDNHERNNTFSGTLFLSKLMSFCRKRPSARMCLAVAQSGLTCRSKHTADMTMTTSWGGLMYTL